MSDTLGGPVGPGAGPTMPSVGGVPQADLSTNITTATQAAPELKQNPGAVVAVASGGGDVKAKAQSVAHFGNQVANASAQKMVGPSGGLLGLVKGDFTTVMSTVSKVANGPLSYVQHEYRYLHDVEARHGLQAAVLEGAGLAAGAAVGTVLDPGEGTVLGAEAAGALEGQSEYTDSWARTADGNTYKDPHTGQLVSIGRDVASHIAPSGGAHTVLSGAVDGLFDLMADPVANVGKGIGAARGPAGMGGLLGHRYTGTAITAENVDNAYRVLPSFHRAVADIARSTPGDIVRKYPAFANLSDVLGDAHTSDEVLQKFRELADASDVLQADRLPTITLTRLPFRALRDAAANAGTGPISDIGGPVGYAAQKFANNPVFGPARWAKRLTPLPGATFDSEALDFTGSKINPANMNGATDLYRMSQYSMSDWEARRIVDSYAAATPAQRIAIVRNTIFKTLFAMAHVPVPADTADMEDYLSELVDGQTKSAIMERLQNHVNAANIEGVGPERVFGTQVNGELIPPVVDEEGVSKQGAILENQTGDISIPNIVEARRMAQAIRSSRTSRVLAGVDDFTYNHVTQGFFKPLVLMSGGYGLHISMAEAIPNALRRGLIGSLKTVYDRALGGLGYKADEDELGALSGWLYEVGGDKLIKSSEDAKDSVAFYAANEGNKTTPGVNAGEMTSGETQPEERRVGAFRQRMAMGTRESTEFSTFGNEDNRFPKMWQSELRENANSRWARTAAQAYLDAGRQGMDETAATEYARQEVAKVLHDEPQAVKDNFVRMQYKTRGAPPSWTAEDSHAQAIVDKVKGSVHARNPDVTSNAAGPLHIDLLHSVANGHTPNVDDLEKIDPIARPLAVKGRQVIPEGTGTVQRFANVGFRKVLNPMVNILSRNQESLSEFLDAMRPLRAKVADGTMTYDEAVTRARAVSTVHSMRFVHNLHDRTQWTATMRNWAPFYFAQEQAYRRMGRLLAEDPGAFRRYQMMIAGVGNLSANMQDGNGNNYIAFPGSGFMGKGVADIMGMHGMTVGSVAPAAFGGSFSSANVIFPLSQGFKPDLGPVALVPAQSLATFFPELGTKYPKWSPITNVAAGSLNYITGSTGSQSQSVWEQLIPNAFVLRIIQAENGNDRSFNSSVMQAYNYFDYMQGEAVTKWEKDGKKGPMPRIVPPQDAPAPERQEFANKVRNYVRALYVARAITGMVSPVSSEVVIQNFGFPQKLQDEITKAGSVNAGMSNFLLKYPNAVPWTVAESYVPSDTDQSQPLNYSLASSVPAEQWVTANQAGLNKYGNAFLWLMPQLKDSKYSSAVYNEQIAQGLRIKETPQEHLNALYVAAGDSLYYPALTVHENALTAAGNNSAAKNAEYNSFNSWVTNLEKAYPVWAENFNSATRQTDAQQAIKTLTNIFSDGAAPKDEQSSLTEQLLTQYQAAAAAYQAAGNVASYSKQLSAQSKVSDSWVAYLDQLEVSTPQLRPIIQSVFKDALKVQT